MFSGVALFAGFPNHLQGQEGSSTESSYPAVPVGLSTHGLPGLLNVPNATALPLGWVDANFNNDLDTEAVSPLADRQYNVQIAFSLFDRLVISGGGSEVRGDAIDRPPFIFRTFDGHIEEVDLDGIAHRDLRANVSVLLLRESDVYPAVAVGFQDVGGASSLFRSRHIVGSKALFDKLRLTAGAGIGPDLLDGLFGGLEWSPIEHATLLGEYDANQFNAGVRLRPLPQSLALQGFPQPSLDLLWFEEEGFVFSVTLRTLLDTDQDREPAPRRRPEHASSEGIRPVSGEQLGQNPAARLITDELVALGFENVAAFITGTRLTVEYENRRFNQHELDGLSRVLESSIASAPKWIDTIRAVVRQRDLPVLEINAAAQDVRGFLWADLPSTEFENRVEVLYSAPPSAAGQNRSEARNRSRLKLDLILRPGIETVGFSDIGIAEARFHLEPNALLHLWPGGLVDVQYQLPLGQTSKFELVRGPLPDPALQRALLHHAQRLTPDTRDLALWTQWSVGRFSLDDVGIRQQTLLLLMGGRLSLGADVALVGNDTQGLEQLLSIGTARYLIPELDTRLSVSTGRYLDKDRGVVGEVSRFFGDTEIALFLRHSGRGSLAGIRFALPLTPSRDLPATRIRVRGPKSWSYSQSSIVFRDRNPIRGDIARTLPSPHGLDESLFDRDRLHPAQWRLRLADSRFWRR